MDQSTTNVKKQEMFRKRSRTVFNKADELARKCDVKVYCLLEREDKLYKYTSSDDPNWPPTTEELGHSYPAPEVWQLAERRTKRMRPDLQVQTRQTTQSRENLSKAREEDEEQSVKDVDVPTKTQEFFGKGSLWPQLEGQGYSFNAGQDAIGLGIGSVHLTEVQQASDAHGFAAPASKVESKVITISLPPILQDTPRRSDFSIR